MTSEKRYLLGKGSILSSLQHLKSRSVGCRTSCLFSVCTGSWNLWPSTTGLSTDVISCMAHLHYVSSMLRERVIKHSSDPFSIPSRVLMSQENGFSLSAKSVQITKTFSYSLPKTKKKNHLFHCHSHCPKMIILSQRFYVSQG